MSRLTGHVLAALLTLGCAGANAQAPSPVRVLDFLSEEPMTRVGRMLGVGATIRNTGEAAATVVVALEMPAGVLVVEGDATSEMLLAAGEERGVRWVLRAREELRDELRLTVRAGVEVAAEATLAVRFLPELPDQAPGYIPEPQPAPTQLLVGAHHCPLWEADKPNMWTQIRKHTDRVPALGFYDGANPEVADWETKWAVEHGVSFFIYCWYRTSQGGPVTTMFESAITKALFHSRYADKMKFTIMWENQSRGRAGVSNERDLMENLLPYWIETLFKHPSYLKIDNKPVLFIYRPEFLVDDLGSVENVVRAFDLMREACRAAGFDGLILLGEYRGLDPNHLTLMESLGLDYTFAYCWHVADSPAPDRAISTQMEYIRKTEELGILPQVVTVTQGWSGWQDEGSIWKLPPADYENLLRQARDFLGTIPPEQLGSRMLLLDNWNEWGEGHYVAPHVDNGFGYLDAARRALTDAPEEHIDLVPADLGLGPYDTAYREWVSQGAEDRRALAQHALKPGGDEDGLMAWWAFDETGDEGITHDYSGHRHGGRLTGDVTREAGRDGQALACAGGAVTVPSSDDLNPGDALTIECWVRTDLAGQDNRWLVNRVYESGDSGYRLGILAGKPCFELPLTGWSHHLSADVDLPAGGWVHLAATFDGQVMRLYVDGVEHGTMERPGPVRPSAYPVTLGSYEADHPAFYTGLLDEVRLYRRALSPAEVAARGAR